MVAKFAQNFSSNVKYNPGRNDDMIYLIRFPMTRFTQRRVTRMCTLTIRRKIRLFLFIKQKCFTCVIIRYELYSSTTGKIDVKLWNLGSQALFISY